MVIQPQNTHSNERCRQQQEQGGRMMEHLVFRVPISPHFCPELSGPQESQHLGEVGRLQPRQADSGPASVRTLSAQVTEPYKWT